MEHIYTHAHVRLHFIIVTRWQGTPVGCEAQTLRWQKLQFAADGQLDLAAIDPVLPSTTGLLPDLARLNLL